MIDGRAVRQQLLPTAAMSIFMRVVSLEHHFARSDAVKEGHAYWILEESAPDQPVVVRGRRFGAVQPRPTPATVSEPHVVRTL